MIPALAGWLLALGAPAWSATQLETSELLAATPEAAAQLPPTYEFTLTAAGTYVVRLRDLGDPAATTPPQPLESLQALITRDLQAVAKLEIEYPTLPDDPIEAATQTFAGTPGTYRVHVLGTIPAGQAGGLFDIRVAPSAGGAAVLEAADAIATEGGPGPGQSELHTTFTIAAAGSYQLALDDRNFPEALDPTTNVILLRQIPGGTEVVRIGAGAFNVANAGDTYELFVVATAGAGQAGLYTVSVTGGPSNAVVYRSDNAVGQLPPPTTVNIATAGQYALTLADLEFPEPLTEFSAAVTQNGVFLGTLTGAGPSNFTLSQGTAQLFVLPTASTTGAMSVRLAQGSQVAYADVHIADASADPTTPVIYSFNSSQAVAAGNYVLTLADFRFPSALPSIDTAVIQETTVVHLGDEAAVETVALQAGRVRVLVAVTPPSVVGNLPGNGMFALTLATQPGNTIVFESTQGVGGLFNARTLNLPAAGRYDVSLKDFEFPERLRTSWLAITRGTTIVGQVIGSSTIQNLQLDAGTHVLNFLAQPAANSNYGAYGLKVADSTPPPTVTLSASPTSVTSGQGVSLTWSSTNATSCTASGGWTGTKTVSGTQPSGALTTNTTFEIECTGPGGRDDSSVTVTVNAPSPGGGGGGGQFDPLLLICLSAMLAMLGKRRGLRPVPRR
jgi:hypothetical protein